MRAALEHASAKERDEIAFASIGELTRRFEAREISPLDTVNAAFEANSTAMPPPNSPRSET